MSIKEDLELVNKYQKEISILWQTQSLLYWDQQTYMPEASSEERAEQKSFISSLTHRRINSNKLFNAVKRLKQSNLKGKNKLMVKRLYKDLLKQRKLPKNFIKELSKTTSKGFDKWQQAKRKNDFDIFKPTLKKIVKLKRKEAEFLDFDGHPYNSLIDEFEEGMTVEKYLPIFKDLKEKLISLLDKIRASSGYKKQKEIKIKKPTKEDQKEITKEIINTMGLPKDRSRFDFAEHPSTPQIDANDVRITTNNEKNIIKTIQSSMHESGHALQSLNFPKEDQYTFLYDVPSFGIGESQAIFWENIIGRSKNFWQFFYPKIKNKANLPSRKELIKHMNKIEPNKIRVEADEIHYCLHIILRFELEKGLIEGSIEVEDLPELWNKKMKEYIGLEPENDSEGILQDTHWAQGLFGYFPSYALGKIYASQIYNQAKKDIPEMEKKIKNGNFSPIKKWLKEKIHRHERKILAEDLIKKVCGEGLNPEIFIDYLEDKYSRIYNLE